MNRDVSGKDFQILLLRPIITDSAIRDGVATVPLDLTRSPGHLARGRSVIHPQGGSSQPIGDFQHAAFAVVKRGVPENGDATLQDDVTPGGQGGGNSICTENARHVVVHTGISIQGEGTSRPIQCTLPGSAMTEDIDGGGTA